MSRLGDIDILLKGYVVSLPLRSGLCFFLNYPCLMKRAGEGKTPHAGSSRDRLGLARQHVNGCERLLQHSPAWKELHHRYVLFSFRTTRETAYPSVGCRIGTDLMIHLLTESTIFDPQPNNCFLQLVGQPLDGLRTLAKIEEEVRAQEMVERKRKRKEEAKRARKRRKVGVEGEEVGGREGDEGAGEVGVESGKKTLSRHTSGVSLTDGGFKVVYVYFSDFKLGSAWLILSWSLVACAHPSTSRSLG